MKKFLKNTLIVMLCVLAPTAYVLASARWAVATHFNEDGMEVVKTFTFDGEFSNGFSGEYKYTKPPVIITLSAEKTSGWFKKIGKSLEVTLKEGIGSLQGEYATNGYDVSKSTEVNLKWTQDGPGHVSLYLMY